MRYDYSGILENSNENNQNIVVYDPFSLQVSDFEWKDGFDIYTVTHADIMKPYRISRIFYSTDNYWDIILLLNNIEDPFDMIPATEIYIPDLQELKTFLNTKRLN